jgi:hypothetical protein
VKAHYNQGERHTHTHMYYSSAKLYSVHAQIHLHTRKKAAKFCLFAIYEIGRMLPKPNLCQCSSYSLEALQPPVRNWWISSPGKEGKRGGGARVKFNETNFINNILTNFRSKIKRASHKYGTSTRRSELDIVHGTEKEYIIHWNIALGLAVWAYVHC